MERILEGVPSIGSYIPPIEVTYEYDPIEPLKTDFFLLYYQKGTNNCTRCLKEISDGSIRLCFSTEADKGGDIDRS